MRPRAASRFKSVAALGLLAAALVGSNDVLALEPAIRVIDGSDRRPVAFEAIGLSKSQLSALAKLPADDDALSQTLSVRVVDENSQSDQVAMLGRYGIDKEILRFTPRYPLRTGIRYRVSLRPGGKGDTKAVTREVLIPEDAHRKPTEVTQVFPSAAILPENQLKFYLHFSAPMGRGEAYEHLRLLKADGRPIVLPFLEIGEELWDASGQRFTLLIDPGRIKRGVKPLEDLGPALEAGKEYTLAIAADWKDASGKPLAKGFQKRFKVVEPLRTAINPSAWKIKSPPAGTREPLTVRFPRPLERALLERTLTVVSPTAEDFAGRVVVGDEERLWEFHPELPWKAGPHQIAVDTVLEDLAGNQIGKAFEVDQTEQITKSVQPESVRIPFSISP